MDLLSCHSKLLGAFVEYEGEWRTLQTGKVIFYQIRLRCGGLELGAVGRGQEFSAAAQTPP